MLLKLKNSENQEKLINVEKMEGFTIDKNIEFKNITLRLRFKSLSEGDKFISNFNLETINYIEIIEENLISKKYKNLKPLSLTIKKDNITEERNFETVSWIITLKED